MLSINPERAASCALFCKSIFTKPLIFESTLFFYQGLEHKGVQLPAVINFTHYTHGTGQVRSNTFVNNPLTVLSFVAFESD
jgi:hypothetical protein